MLAGVGLTDAEAEVYAAVLGTRAAVDRLMGLYRKANRTRTAADFVEMISGAETIANQVDHDAPDVAVRRLLALLSAGFTDEHIARSLGCSPRTAQRRVATLMCDLGATSRFQLALRARDLGWL